MEERRCAYRILVRKPKGKRPNGRFSRNGRTILRWIFRKWEGGSMDWIDVA
jgi:hypothetical protein